MSVMGYVLLLLLCRISMGLLPVLPVLLVLPLPAAAAAARLSAALLAMAAAAASMQLTTRSAGMTSQTCRGWEDTQAREW
jgi:hypothetical protein